MPPRIGWDPPRSHPRPLRLPFIPQGLLGLWGLLGLLGPSGPVRPWARPSLLCLSAIRGAIRPCRIANRCWRWVVASRSMRVRKLPGIILFVPQTRHNV